MEEKSPTRGFVPTERDGRLVEASVIPPRWRRFAFSGSRKAFERASISNFADQMRAPNFPLILLTRDPESVRR